MQKVHLNSIELINLPILIQQLHVNCDYNCEGNDKTNDRGSREEKKIAQEKTRVTKWM